MILIIRSQSWLDDSTSSPETDDEDVSNDEDILLES